MLVSVIVITYGHEKFIKECLESIFCQSADFDIEVIISNDKSPDATDEIIHQFLKNVKNDRIHVKYFKHVKNIGMAENFVFSLKKATGKYIAYCEGDDYWIDPLKLQKQVDFLIQNPDVGLVYTKCKRYDTGDIIGEPIRGQDIFYSNKVTALTTLFSRDILSDYLSSGVSVNKAWLMCDYPLWLWFFINSKIEFIDIVTAVYRVLPESASHSRDGNKRVLFNISSFSVANFFAKDFFLETVEYDRFLNKRFSVLLLSCIKHKSHHIKKVKEMIGASKSISFKNRILLFIIGLIPMK